VLFGQGLSDNLFNFNQAWKNFERSLTDDARARSAVVGYNGGHALPNMLPPGTTSTANPAGPTNDFDAARLAFFEGMRDGTDDARSVIGSPYLLATASGSRAVRVDSVDDRTTYREVDLQVRGDGSGGLAPGLGAAATTTGVGAPVHLPLANGPLTVAGVPNLSATVTTLGVDQRLFAALSVGQSPATARVLQNNVMPLHAFEPVVQDERTIELPGVAADVGPREQLYLTISAVSDMFPAHSSARTSGTVLLEDLSVGVPLTDH
jgi:ABC-2 type transport system ATP-binding protein